MPREIKETITPEELDELREKTLIFFESLQQQVFEFEKENKISLNLFPRSGDTLEKFMFSYRASKIDYRKQKVYIEGEKKYFTMAPKYKISKKIQRNGFNETLHISEFLF